MMPRVVALHTGPWTDQPLEEVARKANEWGYQALDLACLGEHFAVQRALTEAAYCRQLLDLLEKHELRLVAVSNHPVGQAVSDRVDERHQATLPDYVWGDGDPDGVAGRAAQEMIDTARAAQQLGVNLVVGSTGSPFTGHVFGTPPTSPALLENLWSRFGEAWKPVLDGMNKHGVRFALEIGPGQTAFDYYSAEATIQALHGHDAFGFAFNPAPLHWQGLDPAEFLRGYADRIWHVLVQDAAVTLYGRSGLLGSLLPPGDPRRGWSSRAPGQGNIDWPTVLRTLHQIQYDGPLAVAFLDADMDRDAGAAEAYSFVRRLDFERARQEKMFG
jgi:sugar phosphate isomerase/epimerase